MRDSQYKPWTMYAVPKCYSVMVKIVCTVDTCNLNRQLAYLRFYFKIMEETIILIDNLKHFKGLINSSSFYYLKI